MEILLLEVKLYNDVKVTYGKSLWEQIRLDGYNFRVKWKGDFEGEGGMLYFSEIAKIPYGFIDRPLVSEWSSNKNPHYYLWTSIMDTKRGFKIIMDQIQFDMERLETKTNSLKQI